MKNLYILPLAAILLFASCTSIQNTYSEVEPETDFTKYNSFGWLPKDSASINDPLYDNQFVRKKIRRTVNKELLDRGLVLETDTPDLYIQYTVIMDEETRLFSYPIYSLTPVGPYGLFYPHFPTYPYDYSYAYNFQYDMRFNYYNNMNPPFSPPVLPNYYPGFGFNYPSFPGTVYPFQPTVTGNNFQQVEIEEGTVIIDAIDRRTGELVWRGWSEGNFDNADMFEDQVDDVVEYILERFPLMELPEYEKLD